MTETRMAYAATYPDDSSAAYAISVATPNKDTAETVAEWILEGAIVYCVSVDLAHQMFDRWINKGIS